MMRNQKLLHAVSGVLYAEDFDEPLLQSVRKSPAGVVAASEPEIIVPSFSLEELRAATEQAHEEGAETTRRSVEHASAAQRNTAIATLSEQLAATQKQSAQAVEQALDALASTTLSLLAVALPALCAGHAEGELRALLQRLLPPMRQTPELQIRVHPDLREAIENETGAILEGSGTRVTWINSTRLAPGDITVAWQNGSALRDTATTCAAIRDAVLVLFGDGREDAVADPLRMETRLPNAQLPNSQLEDL